MNDSRRLTQLDVLERVCDGLDMPDGARLTLGLAPVGSPSAHPQSPAGPARPTDVSGCLTELVSRDVDGHQSALTLPFRPTGFVTASRDWLIALHAPLAPADKVTSGHASALITTFKVFQEMDTRLGGAHTHASLAQYLRQQVVPLLGASGPDQAHRAVFSGAAQLVYLAGLTAADSGACGVGQRYFVHGLRLAQEAGDHAFGANILAAMATSAVSHRQAGEAVQLALAGLVGARLVGNYSLIMRLSIALARGYALAGETRASAHAIQQAEAAFDRAADPGEYTWTRFLDRAYLLGETAACLLDAGQPHDAARIALDSIDLNSGRQRRLVLSRAMRATALGRAGDLDSAADALALALDVLGPVQSSRSLRALSEATEAVARPSGQVPTVARARAVVGRPRTRCCPQMQLAS